MKYNININQKAIIENKLSIIEYAILDVISTAPTWCSNITINNIVYYWIARQKLAEELKSFNLKPDTVYRHLKKLTKKGFLNYTKHSKKDCINLTTKSKKMFSSTMSEINPNYYVGNKSEKNSEINPTYNNTKEDNNTNTYLLALFEEFWKTYPKKKAKENAKKSFIKEKNIPKNIISILEKHKKTDQWLKDDGKYIPYAATWINQKRWEDEIEEKKSWLDDYEEK